MSLPACSERVVTRQAGLNTYSSPLRDTEIECPLAPEVGRDLAHWQQCCSLHTFNPYSRGPNHQAPCKQLSNYHLLMVSCGCCSHDGDICAHVSGQPNDVGTTRDQLQKKKITVRCNTNRVDCMVGILITTQTANGHVAKPYCTTLQHPTLPYVEGGEVSGAALLERSALCAKSRQDFWRMQTAWKRPASQCIHWAIRFGSYQLIKRCLPAAITKNRRAGDSIQT